MVEDLDTIARYFPSLLDLAIHIRRTKSPPTATNLHAFTQLEALHLGTSPSQEENKTGIAVYLSRVCPSTTAIEGGISGLHRMFGKVTSGMQKEYEAREKYWTEVGVITKMFQAERRGLMTAKERLEQKVRELKARLCDAVRDL